MLVASSSKVLVGTVGYHLLSNHSVGPVLLPRLKKLAWPEGIVVEELNWGPIAVVQQLEDLEIPYERVVFLIAVARPGREIGQVSIFQWAGGLPDERQIQACVGDAATGVISIDNLLVIGEYFKVWPKEVYLVDVEPGPEIAGEHLTTEVAVRVPDIVSTVQRIALEGIKDNEPVCMLRGDQLFST